MAQHSGDATFTQIFFHSRTGMTKLGRFEDGRANLKALPTKSIQVDAFDYKVAAQEPGSIESRPRKCAACAMNSSEIIDTCRPEPGVLPIR